MSKLGRLSFRRNSSQKSPYPDSSPGSPSTVSSPKSSSSPFSAKDSALSSPNTITSPLDLAKDPFSRISSKEEPPAYTQNPSQHAKEPPSRARLLAFADEEGLSLTPTVPKIIPKDRSPTYMKDDDKARAATLLAERRLTDPEYKAPSGISKLTKSKAKMQQFSYNEVNRALATAVKENSSLGLVEALLSMGGSVDVSRRASTNMWKKMTNKNQTDEKSEVLHHATRGGSVELVELLASHAGQDSLDEALVLAIYQNDLEKIRTLLEFNASIYEEHDFFLNAIENCDGDVVELLLLAPMLPCTDCRAKGLVTAAEKGSLRIASALVFSDADTNFEESRALYQAVQRGDRAITIAIAGSPKPPTPANLDRAAALAFFQRPDHEEQLGLMEVCLCAGARGKETEQVLCIATEHRELDTVELLLKYNVSVDCENGRALSTAVLNEADSIFAALLNAKANPVTLGNALVAATSIRKLGLDFSQRLLDKGASVNYEKGKPIVEAVINTSYDVLELFLNHSPSRLSLTLTLKAALELSGTDRISALTLLLPAGIDQEALDQGLIELVRGEFPDLKAVKALLSAHASPDYKDGLSVVTAAARFDMQLLQMLTESVDSKAFVFSQAAAAAVHENTNWLEPDNLGVLHFLLDNGASPSVLDRALRQAAVLFNYDALQFLADWIDEEDVYTVAFAEAIEVGEKWLSSAGFDVICLLLEKGASGETVDISLLQAQNAFASGRMSEALVDVLLEWGADINYDNGHAVEQAVKVGNIQLLQKLFAYRPSQKTLSLALTAALVSGHPVKKLLAIIDALMTKEGEIADPNFVVPGMDPPIFVALENYPRSVQLTQRLCELGCRLETKINFKVFGGDVKSADAEEEDDYGAENRLILRTNRDDLRQEYDTSKGVKARMTNDEDGTPAEEVNVLAWACCQVGDRAIASAVVDVLVKFKADTNFTTKHSKSTPLLLAARYERPDIISILLQGKINVSTKDRFSRSALFFAAANGDIKSTKMLLQQKPRTNDGSLHEAARELSPEIMSALLNAGHDPNFTSTKHEGLTPLGELCMYCNGEGLSSRIEDCIELLVRAKVNPLKTWRGKSVLYMALDNPEPYPVTSALLERLMWKHVTDEANVLHEETFYYSPTMYLKKGYFLGSSSDQRSMIQLLKDHGAEDHYYVEEGQRQPQDAVGVPSHIVASERRRRQHEENLERKQEEHQEQLRHYWEIAKQKYQMQEANQQQYLRHQEERFDQQQYHTISSAYAQAEIQHNKDMQRLSTERESIRIQAQRENHRLEIQWESNRALAAANRDRVATRQRVHQVDSAITRQKIATNYQVQRQNVMAKGMIANIQNRSQANALAMKQQSTRMSLMSQYAKSHPPRQIGWR